MTLIESPNPQHPLLLSAVSRRRLTFPPILDSGPLHGSPAPSEPGPGLRPVRLAHAWPAGAADPSMMQLASSPNGEKRITRAALDGNVADRELSALAHQWRKEAGLLRERYGLESLARMCETHARELTEAVGRHEAEVLTLGAAAEHSGYSTSHLRALITDGTLSNVGRKGSPRLLRGELPRKSGAGEPARRERVVPRGKFDAAAIAASVLDRTAKRGRR